MQEIHKGLKWNFDRHFKKHKQVIIYFHYWDCEKKCQRRDQLRVHFNKIHEKELTPQKLLSSDIYTMMTLQDVLNIMQIDCKKCTSFV